MNPNKLLLPKKENALKGRDIPMPVTNQHTVFGTPIKPPFEIQTESVLLGLGCFWGAERKFWTVDGVYSTAVGYAGGFTPNPTYEEVCSGLTGHNEVVIVVYEPAKTNFKEILKVFFEAHNPTQGMRQGNDVGTQYRSGVYCMHPHQLELAQHALDNYQSELQKVGFGMVTTEIMMAGEFYYAEDYHQQYLDKNPNGYCGLGGTGVSCTL